jgi:hypothetical protein
MSKVQLSGNASGTGIFTIASPNSNTDRTLTLPDNTGTLLSSASTIIQNSGPAFLARLNAAAGYSAADNTWTKVPYDTKDYDTGGCMNATDSTVTLNGISVPAYSFAPNVAGYYLITGNVGLYGLTIGSGRWVQQLQKNGSYALIVGFYKGFTSTSQSESFSSLVYMNGTSDYISSFTNQSNGGARNFDYSAYTYFSGCLVRAA